MRLDDTSHDRPGAGRGALLREMRFTSDGLALGEGTVLAELHEEGLRADEERVLACLAIAFGGQVPPATMGALRRAAKCQRGGDKALAAIHLAQIGLRKIDADDAYRLRLAARLLDGGMRPRDLARELGLGEIQPGVSKYSDAQPRVPAGSGRAPAGSGRTGKGPQARTRRWLKGGRRASGPIVRTRRLRLCMIFQKMPSPSPARTARR